MVNPKYILQKKGNRIMKIYIRTASYYFYYFFFGFMKKERAGFAVQKIS